MRDDPADTDAELILEVDPDRLDRAGLADALGAGTVVESLPYDSFRVRLPESEVAAVCETPGLVSVETANAISLGDAGEDVG